MKTDSSRILLSRLSKETLPSQFEAITAEEPLVVVSAGAGTGKTWTLAWRFLWAFLSERADITEILTLTFTEKAAQEMKDRIEMLLKKVKQEFPSLEKRASRGLEHLEEAYISTIHSFAMRTIKERGIHLDVDPQARVLSAPEERAFWVEVEKRLDQLDPGEHGKISFQRGTSGGEEGLDKDLMADLVNSYRPEGISQLASTMISLFSSLGKDPAYLENWAEDLENRDAALAEVLQNLYASDWSATWETWVGPGGILLSQGTEPEGNTTLAKSLAYLRETWQDRIPGEKELPRFILDLSTSLKGARGKLADRIGLALSMKVSEYRKDLLKTEPLLNFLFFGLTEAERNLRRSFLLLSSLIWEKWDILRGKAALLSFDDMIRYSIEVLDRDPVYFSRFREILVDEFQDTNELQKELLEKIWRKPEGQRLFLVGDIKQSIYGFRHAEPALFLDYIRKSKEPNGRYITLDRSFRSRDSLLGTINELFGSLWYRGIGQELRHPYEELLPPEELEWHEKRQEVEIPSFRLLLEDKRPEGESILEARLRLARKLGNHLLEMKGAGHTVWDSQDLAPRSVKWSDMAILVPTRAYYEPLEKIFLDELFIPCCFESSLGYYSRSEVQDLTALIRALSDPDDGISMGHFLSSPFSSLSLEETDLLLRSCAPEDLYHGLASSFPDIFSKLEKWRKQASLEGVSRVLADMIRDPGILLRFPPWKRKRAAANLRKAIDITREYEKYLGRNLHGCAEYLQDAVGRGIRMEDAIIPGEEDLVRVLTVHASKGLEFPVLAIFGSEHTPRNRSAGTSLGVSRKLGPVTSRYPFNWEENGKKVPLSSKLHDLLGKKDMSEEWERLFYVACTRARDSLVLCGIRGNDERPAPEGSWLSMISVKDQLSEGRALPAPGKHFLKEEKGKEQAGQEKIRLTLPGERSLSRLGASAYALYRFCPHAYRMRYRQGLDLTWELPSSEDRGGPEMGSLMHWILERWDFRKRSISSMICPDQEEAARKALSLPPALRPVWKDPGIRQTLGEWMEKMTANPFCQLLSSLHDKGELRREFPFSLTLKEGPRMVGVIDLLWEDSSGIHIVDYKITPTEGSRPAQEELYREQLNFYALAMRKLEPQKEIRRGIFYIRQSTLKKPEELQKWEEMEDLVLQTARAAAGNIFSPRTEHCSGCPFFRICTSYRKGLPSPEGLRKDIDIR